jgi:hypothetical protein
MSPGVNPIFPGEDAFEIDVGTPEGRTLPLRSPELKAMIEQRAGYAVTGNVDDVRIYNRALSATEVKQLYDAGR